MRNLFKRLRKKPMIQIENIFELEWLLYSFHVSSKLTIIGIKRLILKSDGAITAPVQIDVWEL